MKIYKYKLDSKKIDKMQVVEMEERARVVSVAFQGSDIMLWAEVNPNAFLVPQYFYIAFTGSDKPSGKHLATLIDRGHVFHVYSCSL